MHKKYLKILIRKRLKSASSSQKGEDTLTRQKNRKGFFERVELHVHSSGQPYGDNVKSAVRSHKKIHRWQFESDHASYVSWLRKGKLIVCVTQSGPKRVPDR